MEIATELRRKVCDQHGRNAGNVDTQNHNHEYAALWRQRLLFLKGIYIHCSVYRPCILSCTSHGLPCLLGYLGSLGLCSRKDMSIASLPDRSNGPCIAAVRFQPTSLYARCSFPVPTHAIPTPSAVSSLSAFSLSIFATITRPHILTARAHSVAWSAYSVQ